MWHSRPPRDPPPLLANAILNFHFDFLTPSLIRGAFQATGGALEMLVSSYIQSKKKGVFNGQILSIFDIDDSANILSEPLSEMLAS